MNSIEPLIYVLESGYRLDRTMEESIIVGGRLQLRRLLDNNLLPRDGYLLNNSLSMRPRREGRWLSR